MFVSTKIQFSKLDFQNILSKHVNISLIPKQKSTPKNSVLFIFKITYILFAQNEFFGQFLILNTKCQKVNPILKLSEIHVYFILSRIEYAGT